MSNKTLFRSIARRFAPAADTVNDAGAPAYAFTPKHALAQYVSTGCMSTTFYASAEEQLDRVLELAGKVDPLFVAKAAVYCRERGYMKDTPSLLCAVLSVADRELLDKIFPRVIDNGRMLRNFVQIIRSGVVGRKSLGSMPRRLVREWFDARTDEQVFYASVGNSPSLADIVKMTHPRPVSANREALYGYMLGRDVDQRALPKIVKDFERFKGGRTHMVPDVPFQMLTSLDLGAREWAQIARNASWQMTRMNLNTFARHGVFEMRGMTRLIAERLRDRNLVKRARVFPYQLMIAYKMTGAGVPYEVRDALQDAMGIAIENVPVIDGEVYVCPDVSGSMTWAAVTGNRPGATSAVRCIDVAALTAAAIVRRNPKAVVLPFENTVVNVDVNPRDSVMTNADKLATIGGGGTNCSAPLALLNQRRARVDTVIFISDNESWVDATRFRAPETMNQWSVLKKRNRRARMVCIDIQPNSSTQAVERRDILNIGGFSDSIFGIVDEFAKGNLSPDHWVGEIEKVQV